MSNVNLGTARDGSRPNSSTSLNSSISEIRQRALGSSGSPLSGNASRNASPTNNVSGRVEREVEALRAMLSSTSTSAYNPLSNSATVHNAGSETSTATSAPSLQTRNSPLPSMASLGESYVPATTQLTGTPSQPNAELRRFPRPASYNGAVINGHANGVDATPLLLADLVPDRRRSSPVTHSPSSASLLSNPRNNVTVAHIMTDAAQKILPGGSRSSASTSSVNSQFTKPGVGSAIFDGCDTPTLERRQLTRRVSDYAPSPLRETLQHNQPHEIQQADAQTPAQSTTDSSPNTDHDVRDKACRHNPTQENTPELSPSRSVTSSRLSETSRTSSDGSGRYWPIESVLAENGEAAFSHGLVQSLGHDFVTHRQGQLTTSARQVANDSNCAFNRQEHANFPDSSNTPTLAQQPLFQVPNRSEFSTDSLISNPGTPAHPMVLHRANGTRSDTNGLQATETSAQHIALSQQRRTANALPPARHLAIYEETLTDSPNESGVFAAGQESPWESAATAKDHQAFKTVESPTFKAVSQEDIQRMKSILVKETTFALEEIFSLFEGRNYKLLSSTLFAYLSQLDKLCKLFVRFPAENESMFIDLLVADKIFGYIFKASGDGVSSGARELLENSLTMGLEQMLDQVVQEPQVLDNMSVSTLTVVLHFISLYEKLSNPKLERPIGSKTKLLMGKLFAAFKKIPETTSGVIMRRAFEFVYVSSLENMARHEASAYASKVNSADAAESSLIISPSVCSTFNKVAGFDARTEPEETLKTIGTLQILKNEFRTHLRLFHNYIDSRVDELLQEAKAQMTEEELKEFREDDKSSYGISPTNDETLERVIVMMQSLNEINNSLKLVHYSEFYNDSINQTLQVRDDYPKWKVREGFSFCQYPFVLNTITKSDILKIESMVQMRHGLQDAFFRALFVGVNSPYLIMEIRRAYLIRDAMFQLASKSSLDLKKQLRISFVGEDGVDEGGIQKEFFQLVFREIFDKQYGMFQTNSDTNLAWFATASSSQGGTPHHTSDHSWLEEYNLIGKLIGLAIYNGVILDLHFPLALYKKLVGLEVDLDDLRELDRGLADGLSAMVDYKPQSEDEAFEDIFGERYFTIDCEDMLGTKFEVELEPNGSAKAVTWANRAEFVEKYVDYIFNTSCKASFDAFFEGFDQVLGDTVVVIFRPEELEELVCGSPCLDFKELEENTKYDGFTAESDTIKYFWEIVHQLTPEQKQKLLFFTTGSDRVPIGGLSKLAFIIAKNGADDNRLPTAHTCFNVLMLSQYSGKELLKQKLFQALEFSDGGFFLS